MAPCVEVGGPFETGTQGLHGVGEVHRLAFVRGVEDVDDRRRVVGRCRPACGWAFRVFDRDERPYGADAPLGALAEAVLDGGVVARAPRVAAVALLPVDLTEAPPDLAPQALALVLGQHPEVDVRRHLVVPIADTGGVARGPFDGGGDTVDLGEHDGGVLHQADGGEVVVAPVERHRRVTQHDRRALLEVDQRGSVGLGGVAHGDGEVTLPLDVQPREAVWLLGLHLGLDGPQLVRA